MSKKHRKFAEDDANFANLDHVLSRVKRRTLEEVRAENQNFDLASEHETDEDAEGELDDEDCTMTLPKNTDEEVEWEQ